MVSLSTMVGGSLNKFVDKIIDLNLTQIEINNGPEAKHICSENIIREDIYKLAQNILDTADPQNDNHLEALTDHIQVRLSEHVRKPLL